MPDLIGKLFSSDYMPHGMCYYWDPVVLWLNVISDSLIALSYYAIAFLLFRFARLRRDISFKWIFVAFGFFILACGTTHMLGAVTVWNPIYRVEGVVKAATAVASVATLILLMPLLPELIALPSPAQLKSINDRLAAEIEERRAAEENVRRINEELEARVTRRTAERHALQDQLLHAQKMEAVGRLAGGVAHDFNNLLTVILGYTELLEERLRNDAETLEYAGEVQRAARRASALTNQLLAFSRRQVSQPRIVDVNEVVRQIDRMLRRVIGEDVDLEIQLAPTLPPVMVDPSHVDQLILNLAVNSRDAMPLGGSLRIETEAVDLNAEYSGRHIGVPAGRYVMLAVTDDGLGMDEATRARIFEPFFTTKESGKGTGLGLSIVYGIVKQNGGEIIVHSEVGHGTSFKIYLPAVSGQPVPLEQTAEVAVPMGGGETILLVEDDQSIRDLARTMLHRDRYRVLEAAGPVEALRVAVAFRGPIHLLLTDVVMAGASGIDLARDLTAARPEIRVLFMSGYAGDGPAHQGILAADIPFLQKPFTGDRLRRKIREVLG
jgi:signal transduction histidine kinase/CheY-like chemotaxis protein